MKKKPSVTDSESVTITEPGGEKDSCAESPAYASAPCRNEAKRHGGDTHKKGGTVIFLPLNDKTEYPVYEEQANEWADLYPAVDVIQQLRGMKLWPGSERRKGYYLHFQTAAI